MSHSALKVPRYVFVIGALGLLSILLTSYILSNRLDREGYKICTARNDMLQHQVEQHYKIIKELEQENQHLRANKELLPNAKQLIGFVDGKE